MDESQTLELYKRLKKSIETGKYFMCGLQRACRRRRMCFDLSRTLNVYRAYEKAITRSRVVDEKEPIQLSGRERRKVDFLVWRKTFFGASSVTLALLAYKCFEFMGKYLAGYEKNFINASDEVKLFCKRLMDRQENERQVYKK